MIPVGACEKETHDELKCHFKSIFKKSVQISLRWLAPSLDDPMLKSRYVNNQVLGMEKKDRWRSGESARVAQMYPGFHTDRVSYVD